MREWNLSDIIKGRLDTYDPITFTSSKWKNWISALDDKVCSLCEFMHGKIYAMDEEPDPKPPLHPNCRCRISPMRAVEAGTASYEGENGADWWIVYYFILPSYYIDRQSIFGLGWRYGKSPSKYAPGRMLTMGIYENKNGHLPEAVGRVWYEADLNYYSGKRNGHRLLWSNDGLVFVTYDHYHTFIEVTGG